MEQVDALEVALANTARLVGGISPEQWGNATPCSKWNVRQLVTHTAGVMANFTNGVNNESPAGDPDDFDLGADPVATLSGLAAANVAAWRARGELESAVLLGEREFPGVVALNINTLDAYVHGWDIAQATGQNASLDDEISVGLLGFAQEEVTASPREGDNFHAVVETAPAASPADQLIGYLGRQP